MTKWLDWENFEDRPKTSGNDDGRPIEAWQEGELIQGKLYLEYYYGSNEDGKEYDWFLQVEFGKDYRFMHDLDKWRFIDTPADETITKP